MRAIDFTHDPARVSWVDSANVPGADFPIQNLPFGVFRRAGTAENFRCATAIGQYALDLGALDVLSPLEGLAAHALATCAEPSLEGLMRLGPQAWTALRQGLSQLLTAGSLRAEELARALVPLAQIELALPVRIGDYTDF